MTIRWSASASAICSKPTWDSKLSAKRRTAMRQLPKLSNGYPTFLLDLQMPRLPGLEAMRAIMSGSPTVKILLLTSTITTQQIIEGLQIGARGIVLKDALADHLTTAIRAVSSGDYWIDGRRVVNLVGALQELMQKAAVPERKTYGLTPRELEVVGCIVEGCSNRDIAKQFSISEETVKRHLSNIFDKTGVSTRLELALFAIAHQLVVLQS